MNARSDRRQLLALLGHCGLAAAAGPWVSACSGQGAAAGVIGGIRLAPDRYGIASVSFDGLTRWVLEAPGRMHGLAVSPDGRVGAAVARRPGAFLLCFDPRSGRLTDTITAPPGHHFEGHACFGDDLLWVSAAAAPPAAGAAPPGHRGVLLAYTWRRDRFEGPALHVPVDAIGLHELRFARIPGRGARIVLAAGGWDVDGRQIRNADSFDSALLVLHPDGRPDLTLAAPRDVRDDAPLSLRHLDVDTDGRLFAGLQYPEPRPTASPLVYGASLAAGALADPAGTPVLRPLAPPPGGWPAFGGYVASVGVSPAGQVAATSPHGHVVVWWDARDGACLGQKRLMDAAPVSTTADGWIAGTGTGILQQASARHGERTVRSDQRWDNHWLHSAYPGPTQG